MQKKRMKQKSTYSFLKSLKNRLSFASKKKSGFLSKDNQNIELLEIEEIEVLEEVPTEKVVRNNNNIVEFLDVEEPKLKRRKVRLKPQVRRKIQYTSYALSAACVLLLAFTFFFSNGTMKIGMQNILYRLGIYTHEIKNVEIQTNDYNNPGSWHIDKSAEWIEKDKVEITVDLNSVLKVQNEKSKDIILVLDNSFSMQGKIEQITSQTKDYIDYLLGDSNNRVAIITYNIETNILTPFTNNKEEAKNVLDHVYVQSSSSYEKAYQQVYNFMENYQKDDNREVKVVLITDGHNIDSLSRYKGLYQLLKDKYPYLSIYGIQYYEKNIIMDKPINLEMDSIVDKRFDANPDTYHNAILRATYESDKYENMIVETSIGEEFTVNSIDAVHKTLGTVELVEESGKQKVIWNPAYNDFATGSKAQLKIEATVNEINPEETFYEISEGEKITYKLENGTEKAINSNQTPVLKNQYTITYEANPPQECNINQVETEKHPVYQTVTKKKEELQCEGYAFKGWKITTEDEKNIVYINDDTFYMPGKDITIKGTWTKQHVNMTMDGTVYERTTLYRVIEKEALNNGLAVSYPYSHQDSFDPSLSTEEIYLWKSTNTEQENQLMDKINVIFGGFCWQMIRTTDTGGVKMIYNGVPINGTCNNTGSAQQIGTSKFNTGFQTVRDAGYMNNYNHPSVTKSFQSTETVLQSSYITENSWYADEVSYNPETGMYSLVNPITVPATDYESIIGKYTFNQTNADYTNAKVQYVEKVYKLPNITRQSFAYIILQDGMKINNYPMDHYTYGSSYTNNGNGTYTIDSPTTIDQVEYYSDFENVKEKYVCKNAVNNTCSNVWYVNKSASTNFNYIKQNTYKFANGFTYENGEYTLNNVDVTYYTKPNELNGFRTAHYSCLNETGVCQTLYYMVYHSSVTSVYMISMNSGKSITDIYNLMALDDNVNVNDSTIKKKLEDWYEANLLPYGDLIEDTIFCQSRNMHEISSWNPKSGPVEDNRTIVFKGSPWKCENITDSFSTQNEKAKLKYPIGLMTEEELGYIGTNIRTTGNTYWVLDPHGTGYNAVYYGVIYYDGRAMAYAGSTSLTLGVRPAISLKPGVDYCMGDGSREDPFLVDCAEFNE